MKSVQRPPHNLYRTAAQLFGSFFRIGVFTFGGGYAMLPLIEREVIAKRGWTDQDEILNIFALAQTVPGVIAVNSAILIGHKVGGLWGAVAATVGVIAPSLLIIMGIAAFFTQLQSNPWVMRAFSGIRAAVVGLVAAAALRIAKRSCRTRRSLALAAIVFLLNQFTSIHVLWLLIAGGLSGFLLYQIRRRRGVGA